MKKYELKYTKGDTGIFRMSIVENPAVKSQLVMFSEEAELLEFKDDERQVIYSMAMRPNTLIPRKDINGEPAMVFYSEETCDNLLENFFKNNSHNGATVNHDKNSREGIYIFEAWKVLDPEKDKSNVLGIKVEKGDIMMGQKIEDPEIWQKVKNKELTGLSFEAYLEPVLTNNQIEMTKEEVDARIKAVIQMTAEEDAAKKKEEEDAAAAEAEKVKMAEDEAAKATPPADDLQKKVDELTAENIALKAKLAELEVKEIDMSAEIAAAKKVAVEMGAELAKGIKPNSAPQKKYEEMSNVEKVKFNRGKL